MCVCFCGEFVFNPLEQNTPRSQETTLSLHPASASDQNLLALAQTDEEHRFYFPPCNKKKRFLILFQKRAVVGFRLIKFPIAFCTWEIFVVLPAEEPR